RVGAAGKRLGRLAVTGVDAATVLLVQKDAGAVIALVENVATVKLADEELSITIRELRIVLPALPLDALAFLVGDEYREAGAAACPGNLEKVKTAKRNAAAGFSANRMRGKPRASIPNSDPALVLQRRSRQ
ncbi:MAG TPA: hypothetical protein VHR86_05310, partial [Armatimonadota bacterium]|nr:hypothetical protein [Armatimonadota bacterium]